MTESAIQDAVRLTLGSDPDLVLWRNNIGLAWMRNGAPVRFGVGGPGGSDLVGVFRGRAVFIELKTPIGRQSKEQKQFQQLVERKGAVYVVIRSVEDAQAWLAEMRTRFQEAA
jgi:hypothetical protein